MTQKEVYGNRNSFLAAKLERIAEVMDTKKERSARARINDAIHRLTLNKYFKTIPVHELVEILKKEGFKGEELESHIFQETQGRLTVQVGPRSVLTMSWYKMPSGNYEIVAYVS